MLAISAVLLLGAVLAGLFVYLGMPWSFAQSRQFRNAVDKGDHAAIARAAVATIQQVGATGRLYQAEDLSALPKVISEMKPNSVFVDSRGMRIEFHGGFDHFGFEIREENGEWVMARYSEQGRVRMLTLTKDNLDADVNRKAITGPTPPSGTNRATP